MNVLHLISPLIMVILDCLWNIWTNNQIPFLSQYSLRLPMPPRILGIPISCASFLSPATTYSCPLAVCLSARAVTNSTKGNYSMLKNSFRSSPTPTRRTAETSTSARSSWGPSPPRSPSPRPASTPLEAPSASSISLNNLVCTIHI